MMETTTQTPTVHAATGRGELKLQTMRLGKMSLDVVMIGDDPWFYAPTLARTLDYRDAPHMLRLTKDDERAIHSVFVPASRGTISSSESARDEDTWCPINGHQPDTCYPLNGYQVGQNRDATFVNEWGLYRVIMRSNSDAAEPFRLWVFREVLPSLRKTGQYTMHQDGKRLGVNFDFTEVQWAWLKMNPCLIDLIPLAAAGYNSVQITRILKYNTKSGITARKQIEKLKELGFLPKVIEPRAKQLERLIKAEQAEKSQACLPA